MEEVCSPEIPKREYLLAEASAAERAHMAAVSSRKYLMALCAVHPGRAAQLIVSGIEVLEGDEPQELSVYVRQQTRAQKVREAQTYIGKIEQIINFVADKYGLIYDDIISDRRSAEIVSARHIAFYLAKTLTRQSLPVIGKNCGGKDHTTVMHGVRKVEAKLLFDKKFAEEISLLLALLSRKEAA